MSTWIIGLVGLAVGALFGWMWASWKAGGRVGESEGKVKALEAASQELRSQVEAQRRTLDDQQTKLKTEGELRAAAEARLQEVQNKLDEEKELVEQAQKELSDAFNSLAGEALKSNNQAFIALARSTFQTIQAEAKGDLETRQKAIEGLVAPLLETLGRYERQIQEMERVRQGAYTSLEEHLKLLATEAERLEKETGTLATALRGGPQARGRWGELTLRRVAELAGMSEHCDFTEQESFDSESGRLRPDMVVNLPSGRRIAVDAKVPLQAFLDAAAAVGEKDRQEKLARHGQLVRAHMNQLGGRAYWDQFDHAPEIVVLFLPGESFFSAALEQDRTLIEDGMAKRVVLATPTTLIALLHAVAYGWRQERIAENAQVISSLGKELYDRIRIFLDHFGGVGSALKHATEDYNKAVGSLEARVLPSARKFKELGAATGEELAEIEPVSEVPRALSAPERKGE